MVNWARRYPFMFAWVGFVFFTTLLGYVYIAVLGKVFQLVPGMDDWSRNPLHRLIFHTTSWACYFVIGFYVFKLMVKKNILGQVDERGKPKDQDSGDQQG